MRPTVAAPDEPRRAHRPNPSVRHGRHRRDSHRRTRHQRDERADASPKDDEHSLEDGRVVRDDPTDEARDGLLRSRARGAPRGTHVYVVRRGRCVLADDDARRRGAVGVGRLQGRRARHPHRYGDGSQDGGDHAPGPADRRHRRPWIGWALDTGGTLYRIDPARARLAKSRSLPARAAYNLWIGGGSVWTADDQGGSVLRIAPGGRVSRSPDHWATAPRTSRSTATTAG